VIVQTIIQDKDNPEAEVEAKDKDNPEAEVEVEAFPKPRSRGR